MRRIVGTTDKSRCPTGGSVDEGLTSSTNWPQLNVIQTKTYHDVAFCGNNGWTAWSSNDFPGFSYTVCFRSR